MQINFDKMMTCSLRVTYRDERGVSFVISIPPTVGCVEIGEIIGLGKFDPPVRILGGEDWTHIDKAPKGRYHPDGFPDKAPLTVMLRCREAPSMSKGMKVPLDPKWADHYV